MQHIIILLSIATIANICTLAVILIWVANRGTSFSLIELIRRHRNKWRPKLNSEGVLTDESFQKFIEHVKHGCPPLQHGFALSPKQEAEVKRAWRGRLPRHYYVKRL